MRPFMSLAIVAAAIALPLAAPSAAAGQTAPAAPAAAKPYTAETTPLGVLLNDPAAKAAMMKVLPTLTPQLEGAKDQVATIPLARIKSQTGVTDAQLSQLDYELAQIK